MPRVTKLLKKFMMNGFVSQKKGRNRKRISSTKVEVTTIPVTPEQAILIKTKFGGVYESL
jgi:hypothetical protein